MSDLKFHINKGIFLICCLFIISVLACVPKAPLERPATLNVEPASGKAAAVIKIKGSNFLPEEEVDIVMTVGDIYHGLWTTKADKIIADKTGAFEVSSGIPVKTPPGTYEIKATGNKGSVGIFKIEVVK